MPTLADALAEYLERLVERDGGRTEIRRVDIAARFSCAPSQVNYVLQSRFSPERGYLVESRRGGGGYIRIHRLAPEHMAPYLVCLRGEPEAISQEEAEGVIRALRRASYLTRREAAMLTAMMDRDRLALPLPERDRLRARLLVAALTTLSNRGKRSESDAV